MLGPADTTCPRAATLLVGPKRVALLAYLALARPRGFQRRDTILPLFWPDHGQAASRNALSNLLYHVRRGLGPGAVVNRGAEEVGLDPGRLWVDVVEFEEAARRGEFARALDLYRGDLLEGFFVRGAAPEFERWLDDERRRLRRRASEAAWALADAAEADGDAPTARAAARRAAALAPPSDEAHVRLVETLGRTGDRAGALAAHAAYCRRLTDYLGLGPSAAASAAAARLRRAVLPAARPSPPPTRRIAVLPFQALGADAPSAFADGVQVGLMARLSAVGGLDVISRTSVRRFDRPAAVPEIAAALGVGWVLEGEVLEGPAGVRLAVRLVDAPNDRQVWAGDFRRPLATEGVSQIQAEVAREVAGALRIEVGAAPDERPHTPSLDAYRFWAEGRRRLDERTEAGMREAVRLFRQALAADPQYPLALVGLSDALGLLYDYRHEPDPSVLKEAEAAARRALAAAPDLAEAHASLGALSVARRDGVAGLYAFDRAVELRPDYAEAHNWRSYASAILGRPEDALASARQAVALDPLSPEAVINLGFALLITGEPEGALAEARRVRELSPGFVTGAFYEGLPLLALGRPAEAAAVLEGVEEPWSGLGPQTARAVALAALGRYDEVRAALAMFEAEGDAFAAAVAHLALGDVPTGEAALGRVREWGAWTAVAVHHLFGPLWATLPPRTLREARARAGRAWGAVGAGGRALAFPGEVAPSRGS
ncbi:hypothetical protein BSZ37_03890 [Rubrivirga marina]|uniref:Bacterial transcriptional activator domain-containing protein n=1 Tax=Rubrivirga marina TaxID=1196024 RepID=A0A271IWN1_9BACT|nr:hypothetical protein BSZ37_03890 [Rubrivirga marina]